MHATIVSTYPPRACGLATFARDLRSGLIRSGLTSDVISVIQEPSGEARRPEVTAELWQQEQAAYSEAADRINRSEADVLCVQHEFGIFGGPEGQYVLDLMDRARQPVVTTLHTVLPDPPAHYRSALTAVARRSDRLVVMTETARDLLEGVYGVPPSKVAVIPHGTPDLDPTPDPAVKERLGLGGRTVALTFGLLGPSKGIEFALAAMERAIAAQPDFLYVVLGSTHPDIVRREGEAYRERLQAEVSARGLTAHVRFEDRFVDTEDLWDWLRSADVYVSPYPGMDQICSGTLAYALAAGLPVVSTPYLHAKEVLRDGAGMLVPFGDVDAFGTALAHFACDADARAEAGARAQRFGETTTWAQTGVAYVDLFADVLRQRAVDSPIRIHPGALPTTLGFLVDLTDDTGPLQHATFGVPDRLHGYCTDDAGRALVVAFDAARRLTPESEVRRQLLQTARTCLSFVHHAQRPDGSFHNFMDYGRRFVDDPVGEDTVGRALWGLGATVAWAPEAPFRLLARSLMDRSLRIDLTHPRAIAYACLGVDLALERFPDVALYRERLSTYAQALVERFERTVSPRWRWFCDDLTYANALVPHALLRVATRLEGDAAAGRFREIAMDAYDFVLSHTVRDGMYDAVGNRGWLRRDGERADYDQQPIDAGYSARCWAEAYRLTGEDRYASAARRAVDWFYGRNRIAQPLFDMSTGGCFDGFSHREVNLNQGAESAIACALAHLAAEDLGLISDPVDLRQSPRGWTEIAEIPA